jgi:hypothetical protein
VSDCRLNDAIFVWRASFIEAAAAQLLSSEMRAPQKVGERGDFPRIGGC